MSLARAPWSPAMSDGFSAPQFALVVDWALRLAAKVSLTAAVRHDERYHRGGSLNLKLRADWDLAQSIMADLLEAGEDFEQALGTACAVFRGLQLPDVFGHWYRPPTVERGPQESA